jgi:hypothetical protein
MVLAKDLTEPPTLIDYWPSRRQVRPRWQALQFLIGDFTGRI